MYESCFPCGTSVCVRQTIAQRSAPIETEVTGVVEAWEKLPTGSWHAHGTKGRLWLERLKLRKADGELTLLVIDGSTRITAPVGGSAATEG